MKESFDKKFLSNRKIRWTMKPFPFAIIDNFLNKDIFHKISQQSESDKFKRLGRKFKTDIEGKEVFDIQELVNTPLYFPLEIMAFKSGKNLFNTLCNGISLNLKTLGDFENFGGYFPFHSSSNKGILGSHVDHSNIKDYFHTANSLFFSHKEWNPKWGGQTILYNSTGLKPLIYIDPLPNRLILFVHSNISFHGVKKICCPDHINRKSYYMDYYLDKENTELFRKQLIKAGASKKVDYSFHGTTFVPFLPNGLKSFRIHSLFKLGNYLYIKNYIVYNILKIKIFKINIFNILLSKFLILRKIL